MRKGISVHAERKLACMHINARDQCACILMKGISMHAGRKSACMHLKERDQRAC